MFDVAVEKRGTPHPIIGHARNKAAREARRRGRYDPRTLKPTATESGDVVLIVSADNDAGAFEALETICEEVGGNAFRRIRQFAVGGLPAGLGDMGVGIAAPWMVLGLVRHPGFATSAKFVRWNVLGILDLIVAVSIATLSATLATGAPGETSTAPMATLPLVLIPVFFVPLFS
jgi:hypothetical protein